MTVPLDEILDPTAGPDPLDNAVWASLTGPAHAALAVGGDLARRYPAEVSPFAALRDHRDPASWDALAGLLDPGEAIVLSAPDLEVPPDWRVVETIPGVQMAATPRLVDARDEGDAPTTVLDPDADTPAMLDLTRRTRPGPFLRRTATMGTYLGVRGPDGELAAMAGERLHPAGWTEISAVCTDPAHVGRGLASRLLRDVARGIRARGEVPFLHTGAQNTRAIRLYEHLGFELRTPTVFVLVGAPR